MSMDKKIWSVMIHCLSLPFLDKIHNTTELRSKILFPLKTDFHCIKLDEFPSVCKNMKQVAQGQYLVSDTRCPALQGCKLEWEAGQRPRRGRSPVEHRGLLFVRPSVCQSPSSPLWPEVCPHRPKIGGQFSDLKKLWSDGDVGDPQQPRWMGLGRA